MTDLKISQFTNGGAVQATDEIATNRSGVNTKVFVGTMAAEDAADYTPTANLGSYAFADLGDALEAPSVEATTSAGLALKNSSGTDVLTVGSANTTNATFAGALNITGKTNTAASATGGAGLNIAPGTAPSSPTNGDIWLTSGGIFARVNGATQQLDAVSSVASQAFAPGGRLTLTTGVPVTTTDVTAASTLYYTPYVSNQIALYSGTAWSLYTFTERSLALSGLTSGRPYDVFLYDNAGTLTLELTAWTNDTTRATALVYQDGVLVRSGATTRRYVGTIYTTGTNSTADSEANRFVWNYYNRVNRSMRSATETADTWTYTTATFRQANANTANQLNFVIGFGEDCVNSSVIASAANTTAGVNIGAAIGLNSTTTPATGCVNPLQRTQVASGTTYLQTHAQWTGIPAAGRNFLAWLEWSTATGTTTWLGDGGGTTFLAGINGMMRA